jgi:cytochrome c5
MNKRWKGVLLLSLLIGAMLACSKQEEAPPGAGPMPPQAGKEKAHEAMREAHEGMKQVHEGAVAAMQMGKTVYEKTCASCHATGVAGAPKVGDKAVWAEHFAEGTEHLVQTAIKGKGAMPPKGGNPALSEEEVRAAVNYMIEQSR